ncbi:hypothetical protein GE061_019210 [Apolygus lucorum]|uniref:DDE Tnp4 domain-containing protein n=1 Tax=Apolygus lucorum TaxID=248454 RepID=A0A6A4JEP6_APOLU|nr:hypothetical protein GE061_019210 [Apolygus lucorum]
MAYGGWESGQDLDCVDDLDDYQPPTLSPLTSIMDSFRPLYSQNVGGGEEVDCMEEEEEEENPEDDCMEQEEEENPEVDCMEEEEEEDPNVDCMEEEGEEDPEWTPYEPGTPKGFMNRRESVDFDRMQKIRDFRARLINAGLRCGGTPSGYTTVQPFGPPGVAPTQRTRVCSSKVSRRIDFANADRRRPRKPLRYLKKRFNEGMSRLRGPPQLALPQYADECAACGGPRRCYTGIEEPVDYNCQPRVSRPKYPNLDDSAEYIQYAHLTRFEDSDEEGSGGWLYELLSKGITVNLRNVQAIIVACVVLHNMCIEDRRPNDMMDDGANDMVDEGGDVLPPPNGNNQGRLFRDTLIMNHFRHLL